MATIRKINDKFVLVKTRRYGTTAYQSSSKQIKPEDYEFKVMLHGNQDFGYIKLGGKSIILVPADFIGENVQLVLEKV